MTVQEVRMEVLSYPEQSLRPCEGRGEGWVGSGVRMGDWVRRRGRVLRPEFGPYPCLGP